MKLLVDSIKINHFEKIFGFTHASSPRYFQNQFGEIEQYDFSSAEDFKEKCNHMTHFIKTVSIKNKIPYLLNQVHSDQIFLLKNEEKTPKQIAKIKADAIITHLPEIPIGIFTADCLPILIYDPINRVAAAIHAGRKGTCQNIVNKAIKVMRQEYGCRPEDLVAGLGPGIGGCCYEIDETCLGTFENKIPFEPPFVKKRENGKFLLDLYAINTREMNISGLFSENIFQSTECTYCSPMNFFSYRREGKTGRILTFIMMH